MTQTLLITACTCTAKLPCVPIPKQAATLPLAVVYKQSSVCQQLSLLSPVAAKRQRSSDKAVEEEGGAAVKESAGRSRENSTAGSAIPQGGGKPPKKKVKVKKR